MGSERAYRATHVHIRIHNLIFRHSFLAICPAVWVEFRVTTTVYWRVFSLITSVYSMHARHVHIRSYNVCMAVSNNRARKNFVYLGKTSPPASIRVYECYSCASIQVILNSAIYQTRRSASVCAKFTLIFLALINLCVLCTLVRKIQLILFSS